MPTQTAPWPAAVAVHLSGGLRAVCTKEKGAVFFPTMPAQTSPTFPISQYKAIYSELGRAGFGIVGADFLSHKWEIDGLMPPEWRAHHWSNPTVWPCAAETMRWSQVGHAAYQRRMGRLWDVSRRISQQIDVCGWRLRQVSEAYHDQLHGTCGRGQHRVGSRFADLYTTRVYSAVQSFLVDACVLRDSFADFAFWFVFKPRGSKVENVTSFGQLCSKVLKANTDTDLVSSSLKQISGDGGWLKELGEYRDFVVHVALLNTASHSVQVLCGMSILANDIQLPVISCPIPKKPMEISRARTDKDYFDDFDKLTAEVRGVVAGNVASVDALTYCHEVLGKLAGLSNLLGKQAPVEPEMPTIRPQDIISFRVR